MAVAARLPSGPAAGQIPDPDLAAVIARGEPLTVARDGETAHRLLMPFQRGERLAGGGAPHVQPAVLRRRDQLMAVRRVGDRTDAVVVLQLKGLGRRGRLEGR